MSVEYFYIIAAMIVISILLASFSIMSIAYPLQLKLQGEVINNGTAYKIDSMQCFPFIMNNSTYTQMLFSQTKTFCLTF